MEKVVHIYLLLYYMHHLEAIYSNKVLDGILQKFSYEIITFIIIIIIIAYGQFRDTICSILT